MQEVTIEFPVVGYSEVTIMVEDDMTSSEILAGIADGEIEVLYDGHSHIGTLTPLMHVNDASDQQDIALKIAVVE